jgi:CDP-glycerol glycerophosphotransferase
MPASRSKAAISHVRQKLALRTRVRRAREKATAGRYARWRREPIATRTVFYESFSGNGVVDSPEAIFRHLLTQPDMQDILHVWALNDLDAYPEVIEEFRDDPRVRFVESMSPAYLKALATSKYLVNNATFPPEFGKRPEQVYVNTWHGVPLKHMGYDMPGGGPSSGNIMRNFLSADYLLSANPFMTDQMYRSAYRLQGVYRGAVIEEGQPRVDRQFEAETDRGQAVAALERRGIDVGDRKIILVAPTWRGESFYTPYVNASQLLNTVRKLQASLDPSEYLVLLKVHQVVYRAMQERVGDCRFLVPNSIPTNVVLGATDILVTDYSSVFFDFLCTGRPILHYLPDLDEYEDGRGLYLAPDQLFGPVSVSMPELVQHVHEAIADPSSGADLRATARKRFAPKDDGRVAERVVDIVLRGADSPEYTVHRDFATEKETLLIYLGAMSSNGIMTSALNLLRNLDYDRFDVSVFYPLRRGRERAANAALIDPRARILPRLGGFIASPGRIQRENRLMNQGLPESLSQRHLEFWTDEWARMFGMSEFDQVIDFSGYGCFAPFLFSCATARSKSIWLHNDMMADAQRETAGHRHLEERLQAVFTTYRYFDSLVSVSPELDRVNSEKLASFARAEQFTFAMNTIDGDRVLQMAGTGAAHGIGPATDAPGPAGSGPASHQALFDTQNLASAVSSLLQHFDARDVIAETRSRARLNRGHSGRGVITFVSVGRLSPEKNHARLIRSFAKVHERHPNTRLVVLGGGKLQAELRTLVESLGLEDYVSLAGQVENPYAVMAESDCFVMSSDYEGQPMVILEARTVGLPIVTTAFASVGDSVPEDAGIVVEKSVDSLAKGMMLFLEGEVPGKILDFQAYNRVAMGQFYAAIGAPAGDVTSPAVEQVVDHAS